MIATKAEVRQVALSALVCDSAVQMRSAVSEAAVEEYAESYRAEEELPPLDVFESDAGLFVADGFTRFRAARKAGLKTLPCRVRPGTRRDATLFAAGANATHGVRRSREDKRRAVVALIFDKEWCQWADREIARTCHVSEALVAEIRANAPRQYQPKQRRFTRAGKVHTRKATRRPSTARNGAAEVEDRSPPRPIPKTLAEVVCPRCGHHFIRRV